MAVMLGFILVERAVSLNKKRYEVYKKIKKKMPKAWVLAENDNLASSGPGCRATRLAACRKASDVPERRWLWKRCCDGLLFSVVAYGCGAETASSLAGVRVFLALETKSNNIMDQSHY